MIIQRLKSKTYWLGIATQALGILALIQGNLSSLGIPADKVGWAFIAVGALTQILREFTNQPVSDK